jgi:hypothetical protein
MYTLYEYLGLCQDTSCVKSAFDCSDYETLEIILCDLS